MNKTFITLAALIIFSFSAYSQWQILNSGSSQNLNSVYYVNQQTGYICGAGSALRKTTDGGVNWIPQDPVGAIELRSVYFFDANTGLICGNNGTIAKTTDGGENWNMITSGTSEHLLTLSFYNNLIGVCCGNLGTTLYTTSGGDSWQVGQPTGYLVTFYTSYMLNASTGWCAGVNTIFSPLVGKTVDGGASWTYSSFMVNNNEATVYGIRFFDNMNGIAVSNLWNGQGGVSRTTNGGTNWTSQIFTYGLFGMDFPTQNTGYSAGYSGTIMKSTDGGNSWVNQSSGTSSTLRAVYFVDSLYGFAVGQAGTLLKTTNGGITGISGWTSEVPNEYRLYQNFPNPFNPGTKIKFSLPLPRFASGRPSKGEVVYVRLVIYDVLGKEVASLIPPLRGGQEGLSPGTYEVYWDGSKYTSGVYFYKLITNEYTETRKMVLLK
jgi:photosystem II stability/assembly factor-like uncharacterized protein